MFQVRVCDGSLDAKSSDAMNALSADSRSVFRERFRNDPTAKKSIRNNQMEKNKIVDAINKSTNLQHLVISSITGKNERDQSIKKFTSNLVQLEGKEVILIALIR